MMPPLELIRIQDSGHKYVPALQQLYEPAFPEQERRQTGQLLQLLPEPDTHVYALISEGNFAGFSIHWQFDNFLFLEHLAIVPALRGLRLGRQVMQLLLARAKGPLVLEVERPISEPSRKRITFYEKLGLTLHPSFEYYQPSYQKGGQPVPLHLMTSHAPLQMIDLENFATAVRLQVYERFYT